MKSPRNSSCVFDSWVVDEHLPPSPTLKVVRKRDPDYGLTEDERQDRKEFIRCYLRKEFELLTMIPEQDEEHGFFVGDYGVDDEEYNAFNTMDFHRQLRPFNKYGYAMKKIMERVKSLAIDHSSSSDEADRLNTQGRYERFVYRKFGEDVLLLAERYKKERDVGKRLWLKLKIGNLNRRILECKKIWERFAPPENWEP